MKPAQLQHVQILRGAAALAVLFFHCMLNSRIYMGRLPAFSAIWQYGWLGVEFFFVLSGFIITRRHLNDLRTRGSARQFLKKRFIRIYPLYWVVASVMLVYYTLIKHTEAGITVHLAGPADFLYLLKCYALFPLPYPRKNFIDVAWTLSYECFFYLMFALAICLRLEKSVWILVAWLLLILARIYIPVGSLPELVRFISNPLILFFFSGSAVAYFIDTQKKAIPVNKWSLAVIALTALLLCYSWFAPLPLSELRTDINYTYLIAIIFALLLGIAIATDRNKRLSPLARAMIVIGDASYSIYLIHPACVMFCYKMSGAWLSHSGISSFILSTNLVFWGTVLISVAAGVTLHFTVEKNLLRKFSSLRPSPSYTKRLV